VPAVVEPAGDTLEFRFTAGQRRRYRRGLGGIAGMVWAAGLVRFTVVDRLSRPSGWLLLVVLAVLLAAVAGALGSVQPTTRLDDAGLSWQWGPRQRRASWAEVTAVEVRERGVARRIVITDGLGRTTLPVPLTGGSLVGPGPDPELDGKAELIRQRWVARRPA
jgi:hypothetical protein